MILLHELAEFPCLLGWRLSPESCPAYGRVPCQLAEIDHHFSLFEGHNHRVNDGNADHLDGVFLMSQAAIPLLKASKGCLVNIASISGLRASTLRVAYGTSKAAVIQLTKQQAAELGEYGIRANCVCPGPVRTKLAMAVHSQDIIDAYHDAIPLNRYGSETEIGEAIAFLCSEKASYVTGQVLAADGGFDSTGVGLPALRRE